MKLALLLVCTALSPSCFAQGELTQKITFKSIASPAKRVMEDLSKKTGVTLMVAPQTANDVLIINVNGVTVSDLMDKIAATIHGTWAKETDGYRLIRPIEFLEQERMARTAAAAKSIKLEIDKRLKEAGESKPFDSKAATALAARLRQVEVQWADKPQLRFQMQMEYESGPPGRALNRLLALLDPESLGAIPEDRRVVFSNKPTRMQRPFPAAAGAILKKYVTEHNLWCDTLRATSALRNGSEAPLYKYGVPVGDQYTVLLAAWRMPFGMATSYELILAGRDGTVVDRLETMIEPAPEARKFNENLPKGLNLNEKVQLRPISAGVAKLVGFYTGNVPRLAEKDADPEALNALMHPELVEPLSFSTTDVLLALGRAKGANLVANAPDVLFAMNLAIGGQRQGTLGSYIGALGFYKVEAEAADGWLLVKPSYPALEDENRIDRPALGVLLRACKASGRAPLDDLAAYARTAPLLSLDFLATPIAAMVESSLANSLIARNLLNYRFYGELSPSQRSQAQISLATLNSRQVDAVERMVYTRQSPLTFAPSTNLSPSADSIYREATVALPNGIPKDGTLQISSSKEPVVYFVEPFGGTEADAKSLASILYRHEHPDIFPPDTSYKISFDKFQSAQRRTINLDFAFTSYLGMKRTLNEVSKRGAVTPIGDLPAEFRQQLQREMANHAKENQNARPPVKSTPPP